VDKNIFEEDAAFHAADQMLTDELYPFPGSARLYTIHLPEAKRKRTSSRKKNGPASYTAYVFEGYPTKEQAAFFCQTIGNCRFIWNRMLADHRKGIYHTPAWYKKQPDLSWLAKADSLALANVQLNLEAAESDAKSGEKDPPKFHKKGVCRDSYKTNCQYLHGKSTITLTGGFLKLPKAGEVRVKAHRPVRPGGVLKHVTVSHEPDGKWLFSVVFQYPEEPFKANETIQKVWDSGCTDGFRMTGLDMSLPHLYIDADGQMPFYELKDSTVCFDKAYRRLEGRIAREQRKLSHMKKHSHNYQKQQRKVAKLYAKAKHQRHDFLRQMAVRLARKYDLIGIEDLDMRAMKKSLRFGKSVSDNGWGLFTLYLEEACKKTGSVLIRVDKWFPSSKTCHHCGHIYHDLKLNDRTYICPVCGHVMDRDYQAAQNIRDEAFRIFQEISRGKASA